MSLRADVRVTAIASELSPYMAKKYMRRIEAADQRGAEEWADRMWVKLRTHALMEIAYGSADTIEKAVLLAKIVLADSGPLEEAP